jgi:large subunit ribosomal protein L25
MKTIDLSVQPRQTSGKGAARRSRMQGVIPAVVYGQGIQPKNISITAAEVKRLTPAIGHNVFINLKMDGELNGKTVMVRDYQVHPLKHNLIHADLVTVDLTKPINVDVEVELVGRPIGLAKQGILTPGRRQIEVRCLPNQIPEKITVDVSELDLHESIHIAEVKMPEGIKAIYTENYTIASVTATREEKVEVPVVAAEGAVPAEGAAAVPGAAPGAAAGAAPGAKPGAAPAAGAAAPAKGGEAKPAGGAKK